MEEPQAVDPDRLTSDRAVRRMAGVLDVDDERPEPGDVTLRVVAGHGDRLRRAARAIAPAGVAPDAGEELRCSHVFCRHPTTTGELGSAPGDRCRRTTRIPTGWLPCPGHLELAHTPRRRWWGGVR